MSCLVDRQSGKIAFISSTEGGTDIETVAKKYPDKIITTKIEYKKSLSNEDIEKILKIFGFSENQKEDASKLINAIYKVLITKDASLIEINPLVITKENKIYALMQK